MQRKQTDASSDLDDRLAANARRQVLGDKRRDVIVRNGQIGRRVDVVSVRESFERRRSFHIAANFRKQSVQHIPTALDIPSSIARLFESSLPAPLSCHRQPARQTCLAAQVLRTFRSKAPVQPKDPILKRQLHNRKQSRLGEAVERSIDENIDLRHLAGNATLSTQDRVRLPNRLTNFGFWRKSTQDSLVYRLANFWRATTNQ